MRKLHYTNPELKMYALRGRESVRVGRSLLKIHIGDNYECARTVTPLSSSLFLSKSAIRAIKNVSNPGDVDDRKDWVFLSEGPNEYLPVVVQYITDCGVIPYHEGKRNAFYNPCNFLLDTKALKKIGIKVVGY